MDPGSEPGAFLGSLPVRTGPLSGVAGRLGIDPFSPSSRSVRRFSAPEAGPPRGASGAGSMRAHSGPPARPLALVGRGGVPSIRGHRRRALLAGRPPLSLGLSERLLSVDAARRLSPVPAGLVSH